MIQPAPSLSRNPISIVLNVKRPKEEETAEGLPLLPPPISQLFEIHGSKFKLHPVRHLGQASVLRITHGVFFLGICKDPFNGFFAPFVEILILRRYICINCLNGKRPIDTLWINPVITHHRNLDILCHNTKYLDSSCVVCYSTRVQILGQNYVKGVNDHGIPAQEASKMGHL